MVCARSLSAAIQGCADGDVDALAALFDCCGVLANTLAAERIVDPTGRADVVVEIFLRLWRRAPLYDSQHQSATRWLLREIDRGLEDADAAPMTHPLFARSAAAG